MVKLYKFWSRILLNSFNAKMYTQFRDLALGDASRVPPSRCGLKALIEFYENLLKEDTPKPWPQTRAAPGILKLHYDEALLLNRAPGNETATVNATAAV